MKDFILQQLFPGFYATYANSIVSKNYEKQKNFTVDISCINKKEIDYYTDRLKADLKEQHDRKKIIEDKAKSLLFVIAVSITAITFSLNYLNSLKINIFQLSALFLFSLSIFYFVEGVIRSLQTLNIRQFHIIQAEIEISTEYFKLHAKKSQTEYLEYLILSKQLNDLINIRLSNYTYASFNLIRNGIILFVAFFSFTIFGNYFSDLYKKDADHVIKNQIKVKVNDSIDINIPYTLDLHYRINNLRIIEDNKE